MRRQDRLPALGLATDPVDGAVLTRPPRRPDAELMDRSMREVLETVEVGFEMGGGPTTVSARFALEVMESVRGRLA